MARFVAVLLVALPLAAAANDYTFAEYGFLEHEDVDWTDAIVDRGEVRHGYHAALQVGLAHARLAGFVEYANTFMLDHFHIGALHWRPLRPDLDLLAGASLELEDMTDEKGYGLRAGARWSPFERRLEIQPEIRHEELFEAQTSVRLSLTTPVYRNLYLQGALQAGDDERYHLGVRYGFDLRRLLR